MKSLRINALIILTLSIIALIFRAQQQMTNELISCPNSAQNLLELKALKMINISSHSSLLSDKVNPNKDLGYIFWGKAGQHFNYSKTGDICLWLYSPDNKIVNQKVLPITGKYILQVASAKDTVNFEIHATLEEDPKIAQKIKQNRENLLKMSSIKPKLTDQTIFENLLNDHFTQLNDQEYKTAWLDLSPKFQARLKNYQAYGNIWRKFTSLRLFNMVVVSKTDKEVILAIEVNYLSFERAIGTITLVFDSQKSKWLIENVSI